jgi:hypothetical protein
MHVRCDNERRYPGGKFSPCHRYARFSKTARTRPTLSYPAGVVQILNFCSPACEKEFVEGWARFEREEAERRARAAA